MYESLSSHMISSSKIKKLGGVSVLDRELNEITYFEDTYLTLLDLLRFKLKK